MKPTPHNTQPYAIHWFRRDLHIAGNPALQHAFTKCNGRVIGVFCFDGEFLSRPDFSANRFAFFLETLKELQKEFKLIGGDLLVLDGQPLKLFPKLLEALSQNTTQPPSLFTFNNDYEPFARNRDAQVLDLLQKRNIPTFTARDHLLFEPTEITKDDGGFYQVYTPYSKRWFAKLASTEGQARVQAWSKGLAYLKSLEANKQKIHFSHTWNDALQKQKALFPCALTKFIEKNKPQVTIPIPKAGSLAAHNALLDFKDNLDEYHTNRDIPGINGTSKLSIYLKNGSINVGQIIYTLGLEKLINPAATHGPARYLKELIWREFYYSILWHKPAVEHGAFLEKYNKIKWRKNATYLQAWKDGLTGYPVVDAGMRQLKQTGWMHNRVRMIVASFLTKDLLINWQEGERWFMEQLLDGDLAPNNGGWQWAASTGCDPQPYFRIFNPKLQSERFDPEGEYIKTYIPELKACPIKEIHDPTPLLRASCSYPMPIVEHAQQKHEAVQLFKLL